MYHYVRDLENSDYPELKGLTVNRFVYQLDYLKRNYNIVSPLDIMDFITYGTRLPRNPCLLTFDDGYIDHYLEVYPILIENKLSGLFFPVARCCEDSIVLDVNKIHGILALCKDKSELMNALVDSIESYLDHREVETLKERYYKADRFDTAEVVFIKRCLQTGLSKELRRRIVDEMFNQFVLDSERKFSKKWYMNEVQMRAMIKGGMHFGGHGYEHVWLGDSTISEQRGEIRKTTNFLNSLYQGEPPILTFSYPYGSYNQYTISLLKEHGYMTAFTVDAKVSDLKKSNIFALERLDTNDLPQTG